MGFSNIINICLQKRTSGRKLNRLSFLNFFIHLLCCLLLHMPTMACLRFQDKCVSKRITQVVAKVNVDKLKYTNVK